jgi:hypothetical protein
MAQRPHMISVADEIKELYPLPACRAYLRDRNGYITSREIRTLRNELPEYELTFKTQ